MDLSLDEWQERLEAHFDELAGVRRPLGLPVFAIEHGLEADALSNISEKLKRQLVLGTSLSRNWLPWVVYAAELGYDYDGEEYWPSYEQRTPMWRSDLDRRNQLRQWFQQFHHRYGGAKPTGPWAAHFSIIAWPITHAILPKDLQAQLARILYEQRYLIAKFAYISPAQVGHLLSISAHDPSSRLRIFLEQEELVGRIVLALLGLQDPVAEDSILASTLQRIVTDLESVRNARLWLHAARSAAERVKFKIESKGGGQHKHTDANSTAALERAESRSVQPRILLLPGAQSTWFPIIEIPSFAGIASLAPDFASFLRASRCQVAGAGKTWNARGWLLYGPHKKKLAEWPDPAKGIIQFEEWNQQLFHLVQSDCRISSGPLWLFRVNQDGTASEVVSKKVRPGQTYVLLHKSPLPESSFARRVDLSCEGVGAIEFSIDSSASSTDLSGWMSAVGLSFDRAVRVKPVGLPAIRWEDDGNVEWFHGERLCIAIESDGPVEQFTVRVDSDGETLGVAPQTGLPILLDMGALAVGQHKVSIDAQYTSLDSSHTLHRSGAQATLNIIVRPPRKWIPGTSSHPGLIVSTRPNEPTLDNLLSGNVALSIIGPEGRIVTCHLKLLDANGRHIWAETLGQIRLPMRMSDWEELIDARSKRQIDSSAYLRASAGRLEIDADDLGCARISLKHTSTPLRWSAIKKSKIELKLINDSGTDDVPSIISATFGAPSSPVTIHLPGEQDSIRPSGSGGLYAAICGQYQARIVVSEPGKMALHELAEVPKLNTPLQDGPAVERLLTWLRDWDSARLVGPLAAQRRRISVRAMEDQLFLTMCHREWARAEARYRDAESQGRIGSRELEDAVGQPIGFAMSLSAAEQKIVSDSIEDSANEFLGHAIRYKICGDAHLCEAALRLAAAPSKFLDWAGHRTIRLLDELSGRPMLLRGARLVVLLQGKEGAQKAEGWKWD